jgi:hypothetical protein
MLSHICLNFFYSIFQELVSFEETQLQVFTDINLIETGIDNCVTTLITAVHLMRKLPASLAAIFVQLAIFMAL